MKLLLENWREYIKEEEDVNEIFGMGKKSKKKEVDLGVGDLAGLSFDVGRIGEYIGTIKNTSGGYAKIHLKELIDVYEKNIDPMISRLMIAKSQIDKETHTLNPSVVEKIEDYKNLHIASWVDETDLIEQLLKVAYNLGNKALGAYKRYRNKVPDLPAYKPKPSIHNLEKLMGKAKLREEVNEIFGMGKDTADIDSETLRKVFETQLAADDIERLTREAYNQRKGKSRRDNLKSLLTKAIRLYEDSVDPLLSQMMVVKNQIDNKTHRWPNDLEPRGVGGIMSHKLSDPTKTLEHAFKVLYLARSQLLGLYAKHKQDAGLPPYNPPKSMYDLEKLMNTAKED